MPYTLTISGPVDPPNYHVMNQRYKLDLEKIAANHGRPAAIMSGCAYGIDTDVLRTALETWPGIAVIFAIPDAPYNTAMVAFLQEHYQGRMTEHLIRCDNDSVGKRYMARNNWMADHGTILAAWPPTQNEELRSGTWATVRRFRKHNKTVHLFPLFDIH